MINKDTFIKWLETYADLKPYSIGRYANAIDTIGSELDMYGMAKGDLYKVTEPLVIEAVINNLQRNPDFLQKNKNGNRMYSASLNHFKRFLEHQENMEFQAELLKEEQEFEKYLTENPADVSKGNVEDKPKGKPNHRTVNNQKVWSRSPRYASEAVAVAEYFCEIDNQHKHFISKFNGKNYVEAHHLIPMQYQEQFDCSLDIHANIVSICLVCHKKIHYGLFEDKKGILEQLFNSRRERLIKGGINISLDEFYSYYQD
ncbi:hypothetical protein COL10_03505 [Bacillus cereus]|uniref:HNH endonuclease n=1 Tax=Bacillus cereus TaxID=1396 RepID=UPI000BF602CA|nr:hypothetical protein [Bacillus cereus]PFD76442.1 hypothetical protein CN301_05325 [Bacillus cereus]PFV13694.1 hypothetical protein COL10_03505 [Bacillus cereus]PGV45696.1 hypothetical protein COD74_10970 [Bacillus cereus]